MRNKSRVFFGILTLMLAGLLILMACQIDPDMVSNEVVYNYTFGDISGMIRNGIPAEGITLDDWCRQMPDGMAYEYMLAAGFIPPLYKDKALTKPFSGSDIIYTYTPLYSEIDLFALVNQMETRGEKTGEITGTITLKNIPRPAPRVYILFQGDEYWWSRISQIDLSEVTGDRAELNWTIPLYGNDANFSSETAVFYLRVVPSGSADNYFEKQILELPIMASDHDVGSLGEVSVGYITLSGTLTVAYGGKPVPRVQISVKSDQNPNLSGSTSLTSPRTKDAPWSIMLATPDLSSQVYFRVDCYSDKGLFTKTIYPDPDVYAFDQNIRGISLKAGELKPITLSGTINATINREPIPSVEIAVFNKNDDEWLGSTQLASPEADTPWSITLLSRESSTPIYFYMDFYTAGVHKNMIFEPDPPADIYDQDVSEISLDLGNIITLSGTINFTYTGQPVSRVVITVKDADDYSSLGSTVSSGAGTPWSITLRSPASLTPVYFFIEFYSTEGDRLFFQVIQPDPPVNVYAQDIPEISLNPGNINTDPDIPVSPALLTANIWQNASIDKGGEIDWYYINVTNGTKYYLWWNDKIEGDGSKTVDIDVYAYNGSYTQITLISDSKPSGNVDDSAWNEPASFTASSDNLIYYIRVRGCNGLQIYTGTYAIVYSTSNTRPPL